VNRLLKSCWGDWVFAKISLTSEFLDSFEVDFLLVTRSTLLLLGSLLESSGSLEPEARGD
jgi:hypothetical protein